MSMPGLKVTAQKGRGETKVRHTTSAGTPVRMPGQGKKPSGLTADAKRGLGMKK